LKSYSIDTNNDDKKGESNEPDDGEDDDQLEERIGEITATTNHVLLIENRPQETTNNS
jgi:hypothetical protein